MATLPHINTSFLSICSKVTSHCISYINFMLCLHLKAFFTLNTKYNSSQYPTFSVYGYIAYTLCCFGKKSVTLGMFKWSENCNYEWRFLSESQTGSGIGRCACYKGNILNRKNNLNVPDRGRITTWSQVRNIQMLFTLGEHCFYCDQPGLCRAARHVCLYPKPAVYGVHLLKSLKGSSASMSWKDLKGD